MDYWYDGDGLYTDKYTEMLAFKEITLVRND